MRSKGSKTPRPAQVDLPVADTTNSFVKPFVKWAGGKTQLLPQLADYYPPKDRVERYIEPFLGSGAVFFDVKAKVEPSESLLWDNNQELICTFVAVRDHVEQVIRLLREHERKHTTEYFLAMRKQPRKNPPAVAARLIYLNKTCFNGLYRVNSRGEFNVPIGRYAKPSILNVEGLRRASQALADARIEQKDFRMLLTRARKGDFIYFDPPYNPRSETSYFTSYTKNSFTEEDQKDLADVYRGLHEKGCLLLLSNSDTRLIHQLYDGFVIKQVSARRNINSQAAKRGPIKELVILNQHLWEVLHVRR